MLFHIFLWLHEIYFLIIYIIYIYNTLKYILILTWSKIFQHQSEQQKLSGQHSFQQTNTIYKEKQFLMHQLQKPWRRLSQDCCISLDIYSDEFHLCPNMFLSVLIVSGIWAKADEMVHANVLLANRPLQNAVLIPFTH